MSTALDPRVQALLDKQAIHEVLCRYCRALDRCDIEMMRGVYWEDAHDAHGVFEGNAQAFATFIIQGIQDWFEQATHAISNVLIELDGNLAWSESFLFSYCRVGNTREKVEAVFGPEYAARQVYGAGAPAAHDFVMGGRYVDKMEKRGEEWRILRRTVVLDWSQNFPSTALWSGGIYSHMQLLGQRDRSDAVYARD